MSQKFKIKKGDNVIVTTGRDKGRTGDVLEVIPVASKLKVQGVNMVTRHRRAHQTNTGGIEQFDASIHISTVARIHPESGSATRNGYTVTDGKKERIAKKSGKAIA